MSIPEPSEQQVRVLVVDEDPRSQKDMVRMLKKNGYAVVAPEGAGQVLVKNARRAAQSFRPHVAILDISLDDNEANRSGIALLKALKWARCILFSGDLRNDLTREIQDKYPSVTWVDKQEKETSLLELIREKAWEVSASSREQFVPMAPDWPGNTVKNLLGKDTSAPATLAEDVLAQLFPQNRRIELESLDQSIFTLQTVSRGRLAVHDRGFRQQLVELGPAEAIAQEAANYRTYIKGYLGGSFHAELVRDVIFWDLGGVLYDFRDEAGPWPVTFHEHYDRLADPVAILAPLRHFYLETWRRFYENATPAQESLGDYYDQIFNLSKRMSGFPDQEEKISVSGVPVPITNPVQWLRRYMQQSSLVPYRLAVTHGDLHGDNLFTDGEHAWVINFERSGPGHILRDFIEMEVDLFTCLGPGSSGEEIHLDLLAAGLLLTGELDFALEPHLYRHITHPSIAKALNVIREHRKICEEIARPSDFREYLWGLLFDLVHLMTLSLQDKIRHERALLLGGIICERLRLWSGDWPSRELLQTAFPPAPEPMTVRVAENDQEIVSFFEFTLDIDPDDLTAGYLKAFRAGLSEAFEIPGENIIFLGHRPGSARILTAILAYAVSVTEEVYHRLKGFQLRNISSWDTIPETLTFVSYSRKDASVVDDIYNFLEQEALNPWMDRVDILPGEKWRIAIEQALQQSTGFVYCLSRNSSNPKQVLLWEGRQGRKKADGLPDNAIYYIPVRLDDCQYPRAIQKYNVMDWEGGKGKDRLARALREGLQRLKLHNISP